MYFRLSFEFSHHIQILLEAAEMMVFVDCFYVEYFIKVTLR